MRTTPEENAAIGRWIGERLNACEGPVRFLLPEGGVSLIDAPGKPFHDPAADAALFEALEATVRQTERRRVAAPAARHQRPGLRRGAGRGLPGDRRLMPRFPRAELLPASRTWPAAASRSSAAAPAPGSPPAARRRAGST